jgi:hypothetical protein
LNPSTSAATVTVSIDMAQGQASPIVMHLPPQSTASLASQDQTRIPAGTTFGLVFSAQGGSGIVVSRLSSSATGSPALGMNAAEPGGIRRWLVPPVPPGESPGSLAVVDLSPHPVRVSIDGFNTGHGAAGGGTAGVTLDPGALRVVSASTAGLVGRSPVEVQADGPVAVELDPASPGVPGIATVPVWPLVDSAD